MTTPTDSTPKQLLDLLQRWGGDREMSDFEAVMWRTEVDPRLRSTIEGVYVLDGTPEWSRLRAAVDWASHAVPRFRQRVVEPAFGIGSPTWVDDPAFDLDYHLRRVRLPGEGTLRELLDLAQQMAMTPFDRARSPWEAAFVEGYEGGRSAFILKLHHSTTDGLGAVQLLTKLLSGQREPLHRRPIESGPTPPPPSPIGLAAKYAVDSVRRLPGDVLGTAASLAGEAVRLVTDREAAEKTVRYMESAGRVLGQKMAPRSPLLRNRSLSWRFDAFDLPFADFRKGTKAVGASVNDGFIAAMLGGFRRYHEHFGVAIEKMPIALPISIRNEGDPEGGNRFTGAQFSAPIGERDPVERMRLIGEFVRTVRSEPALDFTVKITPVLAYLPDEVIAAVSGGLTAQQDVQISNVPGIAEPVYMAGAQLTHTYPFGPLPGVAAMVTMVTHCGTCCVGMNTDRAAVTDPDLLTQFLREGFDEIIALAG